MTTLYTDNFDSDTAGTLPTGWTAVSGTWQVGTAYPVSGTQALNCTTNVDKQVVLYTGSGYTTTDQEVSVDFVYASSGGHGRPCPMARVSNSSLAAGYLVLIGASGSDALLGIYKCVNGTYTALTNAGHGVTLTVGNSYTISIRTVGTTIEARFYVSGGTRPATAQVTTTDSTSSAGAPGIYNASGTVVGGADNFVWTDGTSAASAVTLTGPTSGTTGTASTNFTVAANGVITGTVVVTPSDAGGGGTFNPTTVSISSGSPTGTFTYTPGSVGTKVISVTNNGSLSNPSSINYVSSSSAATAVTMSGPSTGSVGAASTNFTVGANGVISGSVVVTPSDGGGGGSFTPTTVTISSGSPTGTFTYTPATSGAKTISATNNGSLTNPGNLTYTAVSAPITIPVTDSNLFWSPGSWDSLGVGDFAVAVASKQTTACGAYVKFSVTGTTSISLKLDSSTLSGFGATVTPIIAWSINGGARQTGQPAAGSSSQSLATGLTAGTTYSVEVVLIGTTEASGDRWGSAGNLATNSPTNVFRIQGFTVDGGSTTSAYPTLRSKRVLFYGDSITESVRAAGTTTEPADHAQSAAWFVGPGMKAEYGVIGYGATGWNQSGSGNMPAFPTTWNFHSNGRARTLTSIDYVFVMHGFNGTFTSTIVQNWLTSARAAFGASTWIFIVANPGGVNSSVNSAGVTAYLAANPSDTKVAFLDLSTDIETRYFSGPVNTSTPTEYSVDKCHPIVLGNAMIGSVITAKAQALIGGGSSSGSLQAIGIGGLGLTSQGQLAVLL